MATPKLAVTRSRPSLAESDVWAMASRQRAGPGNHRRYGCPAEPRNILTAVAADGVAVAATSLQDPSQRFQHGVTRRVAVGVVDPLEEVDIDHYAGERCAVELRGTPLLLKRGEEARRFSNLVRGSQRAISWRAARLQDPRGGYQPGQQFSGMIGLARKLSAPAAMACTMSLVSFLLVTIIR